VGLKPGEYTVSPVVPEHFIPLDQFQQNRKVLISDRGCTQSSFWIEVAGRLKGSVHDSAGRPAPAELTLVSIKESNERYFLANTEEDGRYEFEGLAPGQYLLQIEIREGESRETTPFF